MKRIFCVAIAGLAVMSPVAAETIITCGDLDGYAYRLPGSITRQRDVGWKQEAISPAQTKLHIKDDGTVDILTDEVATGPMSYANGGCTISVTSRSGNDILVLARCPQSIDSFLFSMKDDGTGTLLSVNVTATRLLTMSNSLRATCRTGN